MEERNRAYLLRLLFRFFYDCHDYAALDPRVVRGYSYHEDFVIHIDIVLLSPALFLSDTFLRNTLPFFKVKSFLSSLTGLLIVWAFLMYFFLCSESLHSPEYKTQFNAFISASYDSFVEAGTNDFIQIDPIE